MRILISPAWVGKRMGFPRANLRPSIRDPVGREEYTVCITICIRIYIIRSDCTRVKPGIHADERARTSASDRLCLVDEMKPLVQPVRALACTLAWSGPGQGNPQRESRSIPALIEDRRYRGRKRERERDSRVSSRSRGQLKEESRRASRLVPPGRVLGDESLRARSVVISSSLSSYD